MQNACRFWVFSTSMPARCSEKASTCQQAYESVLRRSPSIDVPRWVPCPWKYRGPHVRKNGFDCLRPKNGSTTSRWFRRTIVELGFYCLEKSGRNELEIYHPQDKTIKIKITKSQLDTERRQLSEIRKYLKTGKLDKIKLSCPLPCCCTSNLQIGH